MPVTLIIPDFDRTLVMLRWIMSHGVSLFDGGDHTPELQHAFEGSFPTYRQHMDARRDPHVYPGREIITAYRDAVLTPLGIDPTKLAANVRALQMANETHSDDFEIGGNFNGSVCFGFLYVDEDQGSALSKFTREQQSQMASWQFNLPRALELSYYKIRFGFKPERSCDKQVRGGGTFSAPGFSQGFGSTAFLKFDGDRNRGQIRNFMYQES